MYFQQRNKYFFLLEYKLHKTYFNFSLVNRKSVCITLCILSSLLKLRRNSSTIKEPIPHLPLSTHPQSRTNEE